ncbi:lipocalin family protein [Paracoccus sp. Z118]|uniref:lipocalin family protein n=1 Tax=Paracoccus sp. Z118 TaxID=2851017 RepID=UPI001C2C3C36|nr:lipocalin family protein [Paracoccus sp. Z118]MBV0890382.1 lipocalin family protein [Paracoccus sp. Z118]
MKFLAGLSALALLASPAVAQEAGTTTSEQINPQAYIGVWHEIASSPMPFQAACEGGTTAFYELADAETLRVVNRCDTANGQVMGVIGTAEVVDGNLNTFEVTFPQSPEDAPGVNYEIVAVGEAQDGSYPWAAVRSPGSDYAWILGRSAELDAADREAAEAALTEAGVDVSTLNDTRQPPQSYDPAQPPAAN